MVIRQGKIPTTLKVLNLMFRLVPNESVSGQLPVDATKFRSLSSRPLNRKFMSCVSVPLQMLSFLVFFTFQIVTPGPICYT